MPSKHNGSAAFKSARINEEISRELTDILRSVKDPRVGKAFLSIIAVNTTPDLKYCKIRFSVYGGGENDEKEAQAGLKSASGYIRRELASRLNLRITPELTFIADHSMETGARISALINSISEKSHSESSESTENTEKAEKQE